jgi:hypothetical protein
MRCLFYGVMGVPALFLAWELYNAYAYNLAADDEYIEGLVVERRGFFYFALCAASLVYGANRVFAFHPIFDKGYYRWLSATPYTGRQSLPLGPLRLAVEDLPFVVLVLAACVLTGVVPWQIPLAFLLIGYTTMLVVAVSLTGDLTLSTPLLFLLPLAFLLAPSPVGGVVLILLLPPLLRWAVARNLEAFPWNLAASDKSVPAGKAPARGLLLAGAKELKESRDETEVGWPLTDLGPQEKWAHISTGFACAISVWIGLVIVCGGSFIERLFGESLAVSSREIARLSAYLLFLAAFAALVRVTIYVPRARPPLTLSGRIGLRRIIIPQYHKVYVPSLIAIAIAAILPRFVFVFSNSGAWITGITLGLCSLVLLGMGPTLKSWILTGSYRLQRSSLVTDPQAQVRQRGSTP